MRNSQLLIVATLVVVNYAVGQHPVEHRVADRVSQSRLKSVVRDLVRLGNRMGGTASGAASAATVVRTFRKLGLNVRRIEGPESPTYLHTRWTLKVLEPQRLRRYNAYEWPAGFSPELRLDTLTLGTLDDLSGGVEGNAKKIVVVNRIPDEGLFSRLNEYGVRCVLVTDSVDSPAYEDAAMIHNLPSDVTDNVLPVFSVSRSFARSIEQEHIRGVTVQIAAELVTSRGVGRPETVEGIIEGASDSTVIVCAHGDSDSGGPGADDNASGVSGVLEMARVLAFCIRDGVLPKPHYTLRFVVWGSEGISSEDYIRQMGDSLTLVRMVLNFDEIGTGSSRNCLYFEGNDDPTNQPLLRVCQELAEKYAGRSGYWNEATTNPSQGGTDSYVFLPPSLRRLDAPEVEIPSITIFTAAWNEPKKIGQTPGWTSTAWKGNADTVVIDYSRYYHSSRDIPGLTTEREPFNMLWAVKAATILLLRTAWTAP